MLPVQGEDVTLFEKIPPSGVLFYKLCGDTPWLSGGLAVAGATAAMLATKTLHPPGGATALLAVIGDDGIHNLGFIFPLVPVGVSASIIIGIGYVVNSKLRGLLYPSQER